MKSIRLWVITAVIMTAAVSVYGQQEQFIERQYFLYSAPTTQFINTIDSAIAIARGRLIAILGDTLTYKPKIYIKDNIGDFKALIGTAFPDWGAAAALPYREMIALKSPAHFPLGKPLRELIMHEYAHLALNHRLFHERAPRWIDEGVAMYVAAEWGWGNNLTMSRAVVFNGLVHLEDIENMNRFAEGKAQTAYAESYLAVKYILDEYGVETFNMMLDRLRERKSIDEAFLASFGGSLDDFENELFEQLKTRYNIMSLFGDLYFVWIFLAIVIVVGFLLSFRKKKKYYRKWDEDEKYQSTDFDYGDPRNPESYEDDDEDDGLFYYDDDDDDDDDER